MVLGKRGMILTWKEVLAAVTITLLIVVLAFNFGVIKKECKDDACFQAALKKCTPSTYLSLQNLNYYKYTLNGEKNGKCGIVVELKKMARGTEAAKIALLEGKGMECQVPMSEMEKTDNIQIAGLLNYCTGPLKEGMYELIIEKLYTLIIANLGDVIGQIENTLQGEV